MKFGLRQYVMLYDEAYNAFYFYSNKNAKHSKHISINPQVAITIFDSTASSDDASGLQIKATVSEVKVYELPAIMDVYFEKSFPDEIERKKWERPIEAFTNLAPHRFYKLTPSHAYINDVDENMIDYRKEVTL